MKASEIRELLKLLNKPEIISFAGGIPDPDLFPKEAFETAMASALADASALQYSTTEGYGPLRQWIADHMAALGITCSAENILITSGSQQALDFLGKLYLSPGDTALVPFPCYVGALGAFNAYEPRYDQLNPSGNRAAQDYAALALEADSKIKFAYLSSDFGNPTGETLDLAGRERLIEICDTLDCAMIEDGAYQALRYSGAPIPPILAIELASKGDINACRTVYCGSFSKTLAPGLRVGWVCAAQETIQQLVLIKQAADLHSATLNQMAIHHVAQNGFEQHLDTLRDTYGRRCKAMLAALAQHMPAGTDWTLPDGGMFVWVSLPEGIDTAALLARAIEEEKVAFVPGGAFYPDGAGQHRLRLSFSCADQAEIDLGVARLSNVIKRQIAEVKGSW